MDYSTKANSILEESFYDYQPIQYDVINNSENESVLIKFEKKFLQSYKILETSRQINIFAVISVIIIGLAGHFLTIFVFKQKRFRTNSSNVYLLCLAINDSLFLIVHFFEDTIRTYQDVFLNEYIDQSKVSNPKNLTMAYNPVVRDLIRILNITDKFDFTCRLMNYLRYVLRFISVNIIVAYTIQRLIIVISPFNNKWKSKKVAWINVVIISASAILLNVWVLFLFEIKNEEFKQFCDVKKSFKNEYFLLAVIYIILTICIPILVIFISNAIIALKAIKAEARREKIKSKVTVSNNSKTETVLNSVALTQYQQRLQSNKYKRSINSSFTYPQRGTESLRSGQLIKPYYLTVSHITSRQMRNSNNSKHIAKMLTLISFSFVVLNMPYLITWSIFYYNIIYLKLDNESIHNHLYAAVKISEIFYILNYSALFFIYCASGSRFRSQLKYSGNNLLILFYQYDRLNSMNE